MINKFGFLLGLGFISVSTYASDTTSSVVSELTMRHQANSITTVKSYRPVASFWATSGSNTVPLAMASKFLTGGYISPARNEKVLFSLVPDVLRVQRAHRAVRSATAQPIHHFILDVAVLLRADPRTHPPTLYSFSQRAACLA